MTILCVCVCCGLSVRRGEGGSGGLAGQGDGPAATGGVADRQRGPPAQPPPTHDLREYQR